MLGAVKPRRYFGLRKKRYEGKSSSAKALIPARGKVKETL